MEGFTKEVREGARVRADALSGVSANTQQLLSDARSFMHRVAQEHRDRVGPLRSTLADNLRERQDQVRALRHQFHEHLGKMREQLHEMLGQDRRACHDKVADLKSAFEEARAEVANDLREAGRIWRGRSRC